MIRTIVQRTLVVMLVTVGSAIATAQPSTVAPVETTPVTPAYVYPRRLVDRPLLLPEGKFDVGLGFSFRNDSSSYFLSTANIATPVFELQFGVDLQIGDRPEPDSTLASFYVGGLREIVPSRVPGLAVGAEVLVIRPSGDYPGVSPTVLASYKRKLASFFAVVPTLSFGYGYQQAYDDDAGMVTDGATHQLDGSLAVRAQLQAGSVFAFEALVAMGYFGDLTDDNAMFGVGSHSAQTIGISALLSMAANVDLRFSYLRSLHSFEFASDGIVLAMNIRRN